MAKNKFEKNAVSDEDKKKITKERFKNTLKIFAFIKPYKTKFIIGLVFLVLSSLTILAFPFFTGKLIDAATGKGKEWYIDINYITVLLIVVLFFQAIFSYLRVVFFSSVSENAMADVRKNLYQKMVSLPIVFFEKRRVGELTSRITSDVSQLQDVLSITLAEFFRQFSVLIVGTAIILVTSTKLSLFMLITFPFLVLIALFFGRYIRTLSKKTQDELADANTIVEETLQAIQTVKVFTNEWFEVNRYQKSLGKVVQNAVHAAKYRGAFISFIIFALFGGIVLVLWYGAGLVSEKEITIGELTSFIIYTSFIGASVGGLGDMYGQLQKTIGSSERILEILEEDGELNFISEGERLNSKRYDGTIVFDNVHFSYPSRADFSVLNGISTTISAGSKIAVVGQSGAGKTTIAQLLLKFHAVSSGQIKIDNIALENLAITELRSNIGLVPQEVLLFGGTIQENIAYGKPNATLEEIKLAAQKANALSFIESFPEGFETLVGERGIKLSGGQRQRIAIARAILKNPPILILDEATSALDSASEKMVQQALDLLMQGRTTIIIAHRLSTIRNADKIIVLSQGKIVEEGTHEALAYLEKGVYSNLLKMQNESSLALI
jgi:ABC-type multidrug transport system fused ATPase/permease subunit